MQPVMRVVFLFNHDAAHQVAHLAGIAAAMARLHPEVETVIAEREGLITVIDKMLLFRCVQLVRKS